MEKQVGHARQLDDPGGVTIVCIDVTDITNILFYFIVVSGRDCPPSSWFHQEKMGSSFLPAFYLSNV